MNILNQETGEVTALELQSKEIGELAKSLAKAQGAMTVASKDGQNPHFRSSYATLDSIWQATRKPLCDNGLSVVQSLLPDNVLVTTLLHESGQWMRSYLKLNPVKNDPQGVGSALTYGRRYSLAAMVGIAQADDDGEAGSERPEPKPRPERVEGAGKQNPPASPGKVWLPDKVEFFETVRNEFGISVEEAATILKATPQFTPFAPEKAVAMHKAIEKEMRIRREAEKIRPSGHAKGEAQVEGLPTAA